MFYLDWGGMPLEYICGLYPSNARHRSGTDFDADTGADTIQIQTQILIQGQMQKQYATSVQMDAPRQRVCFNTGSNTGSSWNCSPWEL
jgi:hypothetical protein